MAVLNVNDIPTYVAAVGALGLAAFGMVEAIGKTVFVFKIPFTRHRAGLPYVGFAKIQALLRLVGPAMHATYGKDYEHLVRQQYRADRGAGQAPESIRQGVRLGLTMLDEAPATQVICAMWGLSEERAKQLATALTDPNSKDKQALALAARFSTALDAKVQAAFDLAEEIYETRAQFWAAMVAIGLSLGYQAASTPMKSQTLGGWVVAFIVGVVAVPLAPAAKDLSTSLSSALSALGKLRGGK